MQRYFARFLKTEGAVCIYLDNVDGLVLVFQDNILTDQHKFTLSNMICIFFFHLLKGGRMR